MANPNAWDKTVALIAKLRAENTPLRKIKAALEEKGMRTAHGGTEWWPSSIQGVFRTLDGGGQRAPKIATRPARAKSAAQPRGGIGSEHARIQEHLVKLAAAFGNADGKMEHDSGIYRADVAWFRPPKPAPWAVFEIERGSTTKDLQKSLGSLKHASVHYQCLIFLIARTSQRERIGSLLDGVFPEIKHAIKVIPIEECRDFEALYDALRAEIPPGR